MNEPKPSSSPSPVLQLVPPPKSETTGEYLERWLHGRRSLRPATVQAYANHIRRHLIPHLGSIPLALLDLAALDAMYDVLVSDESGLSIASVHRVHAALNSALNHAVRVGLIEANPARLVDLPRIEASRPTAWSASELMEFLFLIEEDPLMPLFALMAMRGLRRGEALGLRWQNVDLDNCQIHIREQLAVGVDGYAVGPPKSQAGIRTVTVDASLAETLALHSVWQREAGLESEFVFCDAHGDPLNPTWVTRYFDRLVRLNEMRRVRLHALRHTSASIGLASGESLLEVSRRLGHSSVSITADIYTEVPPETARASADRLAAYLREQEGN